ncbi:hypothetical protein [Galbibacter orientalis]|uniref:hypothetical protein n=1 Tax=Galbibacter orientalis TaxID=453852 RepID=UPI00308053CF
MTPNLCSLGMLSILPTTNCLEKLIDIPQNVVIDSTFKCQYKNSVPLPLIKRIKFNAVISTVDSSTIYIRTTE